MNSAVSGTAADARSDEQKFRIAAETAQFGGDADDAVDLFAIGFRAHALERRRPALMNHLRHIGNFAAHDAAERRAYAAEKTHRLDAVADHDAARDEPLEAHAVDFVTRQTGQFRCALHAAIVRYSGLAVDARSQTQLRVSGPRLVICQPACLHGSAASRYSRGSARAARLGTAVER